jgi:type IV pilus assembly protein PilP
MMVRFPIWIFAMLALSGCDLLFEDDAPATGGGKGAKGEGGSSSLSAEQLDAIIADQANYKYDPYGKRDPFTPFLRLVEASQEGGPRTALQRYDLTEYQMVGALTAVSRPRGLVEDPTGAAYVVEVGDYIGKHWGQVSEINDEQIVVSEEFQSSDGDLLVTNKKLQLRGGVTGGL